MEQNKRWYDAYPRLAESLEALRWVDKVTRDRIVATIMGHINDRSPGLLEKYLLDFPLDRERRRWYDKDPYLWLMVNGLKYASAALLDTVTKSLRDALRRGENTPPGARRPVRRRRSAKVAAGSRPRARNARRRERRAARS